jgi:phenylpropionate dioxygenase-like ring-hydroxylating dioxygenase large terminal subunit
LDGTIASIPCEWDFPHVDPQDYALPQVRVARWAGFVFINMDPDCIPFEAYAGILPEHVRNFGMETLYISCHIEKEMPCNWKIASEAFLESYHFKEVHPQLLPVASDINTQYDVFGEHVSRLYGLMGVSSPNCARKYSEQEVLDLMISTEEVNKPIVPPGQTARQLMAATVAGVDAGLGRDRTRYSTTELVDSIHYFLFPNLHNFVSISQRTVLRIRPQGNAPDRCLFEIMILSDAPGNQSRPQAAQVVRVSESELLADAPGLPFGVGAVFDQDMGNLMAQQTGMLASNRGVSTLASYQEKRIRHLHSTLDKYLAPC